MVLIREGGEIKNETALVEEAALLCSEGYCKIGSFNESEVCLEGNAVVELLVSVCVREGAGWGVMGCGGYIRPYSRQLSWIAWDIPGKCTEVACMSGAQECT